ncbi:MAG: hypothetical protein J3Q66DRAFT_407196 [Benniella sp.]|nr:MAG: hypothetical protein J3Q66DRAFT_407196 [Benniella sp.]
MTAGPEFTQPDNLERPPVSQTYREVKPISLAIYREAGDRPGRGHASRWIAEEDPGVPIQLGHLMKVREGPLQSWVMYQDVVYGHHKSRSICRKSDQMIEQPMAAEDEYLKKQTGGGYTRQARSVRASRTAVEKGRARDAIARQVDHLGHVAQEAFSHETEHIAKEKKGNLERLTENILAKVVETGKGAEKTADEKVKTIKKAAQDHVENAAEMTKVSFDSTRISADRIVMRDNDQADKAQGFDA